MPSPRLSPLLFSLLTAASVSLSLSLQQKSHFETIQRSGKYSALSNWGRLVGDNSTLSGGDEDDTDSGLVLAPRVTRRKDPLNHFQMYTGGWNITDRHYWASVSYTAAPFFVIAIIWFATFGLCLCLISLCYCCRRRREPYGYSRLAYALSLIFLVFFSIAAIIGCLVLYTSEKRFHSSTVDTLGYVVQQADATSGNLRNVSGYLSSAKQFNVVQVTLPPNVQTDIDQIQALIDSSADTLTAKTQENAKDTKNFIDSVRSALITLSVVMLLLTFLGFVFSVLGMQIPVYILVIAGWILVTGTFILCGIFLLLHNVTGDTCVAMSQWVQNPTAHTALDDVLPCVDDATAKQSLERSREVTSQLVDLINTVITNVSNINFAPNFAQLYFNQSGPLLPILCNPFHPDLTDRPCPPAEIQLSNATQVWGGYVCETSASAICITQGRLNPTLYSQMSAAVNVSRGLYGYGPFLVELADCSFARQTFSDIETGHCPGLRKYSERVYVGLVVATTAVMLSLVLWVIYARERRHRAYTKDRGGGEGLVYAKQSERPRGGDGEEDA